MHRDAILAPALVMVAGTFLVTLRMGRRNVLSALGGFGGRSETELLIGMPDESAALSVQYKNLFEMPVLFYLWVAIVYTRGFDVWDLRLAWVFAGFRVGHGLVRWFAPTKVPPRLTCFALSVFALMGLWAKLGLSLEFGG